MNWSSCGLQQPSSQFNWLHAVCLGGSVQCEIPCLTFPVGFRRQCLGAGGKMMWDPEAKLEVHQEKQKLDGNELSDFEHDLTLDFKQTVCVTFWVTDLDASPQLRVRVPSCTLGIYWSKEPGSSVLSWQGCRVGQGQRGTRQWCCYQYLFVSELHPKI